jgi:uncharacterized protein YhfF
MHIIEELDKSPPHEKICGMTTPIINEFWNTYTAELRASGLPVPETFEAWYFCNNEESANHLARLVYDGTKQATASLAWSYEAENSPIPSPGDLSVITLWDGTPVCIIQTSKIMVLPFDQVPASFANDEGEGDKSLKYWRDVHTHFFSEECVTIGRNPSPDMPVVCENFNVVFRAKTFPLA